MVNENLKPIIENKKVQVEEVREIKNEIPTYEEFMKTYKVDNQVNASFENEITSYGDLGIEKGYGPCSSCASNNNTFRLTIILRNFLGSWKKMTVHNKNDALEEASKILTCEGFWEGNFSSGAFSQEKRRNLVRRINQAVLNIEVIEKLLTEF